uniref:Uncharacterized protein n=1 Tax=Glossina palpalis gambiensis TaxID=67801 RepID=A0A1B0B0Y8_9MUSC
MEKTCSVYTVDERLSHYGRLCNILRSLMMLSLIKSLFPPGGHVNTHFDNSLKEKKSPRWSQIVFKSVIGPQKTEKAQKSHKINLSLACNRSATCDEPILSRLLALLHRELVLAHTRQKPVRQVHTLTVEHILAFTVLVLLMLFGGGKVCALVDVSTSIHASACSSAYANVRGAISEELMLVLVLVRTCIFRFVVMKLGLMLMLMIKLMLTRVLTRSSLLVALAFSLQQFCTSGLIHNSLASIELSFVLKASFMLRKIPN